MLFHKLGFSHIRGGRYPKRREKFKLARHDVQQTLKMVVADTGSILVFMDEVHFKLAMTITAKWYRKGSNPQHPTEIGGGKVMYVGFVVPSTGQLFVYEVDIFDYKTTMQSIRKFVKDANLPPEMKIVIVLDNASWHKACMGKIKHNYGGHYKDVVNRVEFLFLSPYSPDLNVIEMVWRLTRYECTHNIYFSSLPVLRETLEKYFAQYRNPNKKLRSLTNFSTFNWDAPSVEPSVTSNFNFDVEVVQQWLTYPVLVDQNDNIVDVEATPVTTAIACPYAGTTLPALISDQNISAVVAEEPITTNFADSALAEPNAESYELLLPALICEQNATSVAVEEPINIGIKVCAAVLGDSPSAEIDLKPQPAFFADGATDAPSKADSDMNIATAFEDTIFQGEPIIGPFEPLDPIGAEDVPKRLESGFLGKYGEAQRPKPMTPLPQLEVQNLEPRKLGAVPPRRKG